MFGRLSVLNAFLVISIYNEFTGHIPILSQERSIYRTFHLKMMEYTFFSSIHRTSSRTDVRPQRSPSQFKKTEIISGIFSEHNGMTLEISYKKKLGKTTNTWRLNSILLNNYCVTDEIKAEIKNT